MKTLRVGSICLTFLFFLLFESHAALHAQQTAAQPDANVKFQWAFGALKKANANQILFKSQQKLLCLSYLPQLPGRAQRFISAAL
jgi:hypothetical protein